MTENYEQDRKEELLWYGFIEEDAEAFSKRSHDIILERFDSVSLVMNSDLRYGMTIKGHWYGLEEMENLFLYLRTYKPILDSLSNIVPNEEHLVPPGRILTADGDNVTFLLDKDCYNMVLDDDRFSLQETLDIFTILSLTQTLRRELQQRNSERREREN